MRRSIDYTGEKIHRLTMIEPTDCRTKSSRAIIWKAVCECGSILFVVPNKVLVGTNCGCIKVLPRICIDCNIEKSANMFEGGRKQCSSCKNNSYNKERKKNDPNYKLRKNVSSIVYGVLKRNDSSKFGESCLTYLPWTIEELKTHLESQFEPWITWENWGTYDPKTWNDNPTWQIDHIIPQSVFNYTSMQCQEFRDCWALSNLRPYSAKQNVIDGTKRIRHG